MAARKRKFYLDTSVLGFALHRQDAQRRQEARTLLGQIRAGLFCGGYSYVTEAEIEAAPLRIARKLHQQVAQAGLRRIRIRSRGQVHDLASRYCESRVIPEEYFDDALHVAIATLWRAAALVSFNFVHLVRLETMLGVNAVNRAAHLAELFLCQPNEVLVR